MQEPAGVHAGNQLGQKPRELRHAHIKAGLSLGGDLCDVLQEARLPKGFSDGH